MQALAHLSREERIGLGVAAAAHVALFATLALYDNKRAPMPIPERMVVSLADEVSLESTAPDPSEAPRASVAPEIAPLPTPPEPVVAEPVRTAPQPRPATRPSPQPRPSATATARPKPSPTPTRRPGGSRIGADFLPGAGTAEQGERTGSSAATFGPAEAASLNSAISRQLKPHWNAPQGIDVEQLITIVRFRLNPDGSLNGNPECTQQSGITASNEPQKGLHCERAIRAVRLAAPFDLPDEFYDKWKLINSRFDRRL